MRIHTIHCAMISAGLISCTAYAGIQISVVGDGTGYDILGNATNEVTAYRSTGVKKTFDIDGDHVYGTAGLLMFGSGDGEKNQQPFSLHVAGLPWATFSAGADFSSVAQAVHAQGPMDDPTVAVSAAVRDRSTVGSAVTTSGGTGALREILTFTVSPEAPQQFRVGLVGGTQNQADGRWDPTGYTLSSGTETATVTGLENNKNGFANFVFFDIGLNGATNATFSISGAQRLATQGASLTGITFDVPGAGGRVTPITPSQHVPSWSDTQAASTPTITLEEKIARLFLKEYRKNEARLLAIEEQLKALPQPYLREPTGTGGYLSHEFDSSSDEVSLTFIWDEPVEIDAVALFPLRLYMDEIYAENLYWPGSITISAIVDNQVKVIGQSTDRPFIAQSHPKLIEFKPVVTRRLTLRCTDLPQHPYEKWHAAGFAEICIFAGSDNVAPRAECKGGGSREGHHVLAREFLVDAQTPLGLPELNSHSKTHTFVKKIGFGNKVIPGSYILTCIYPQEIPIDAVRVDPAVEHSYGQSFPVRFSIELLDAQGRVMQSDDTYKYFPMRKPGLNPHFSYFPETPAQSVRLIVYEASQPIPKAMPAIAFSEITALYKGEEAARASVFEETFMGKKLRTSTNETQENKLSQMLVSANDGLTHSGQVLPLRTWIEKLTERQQLMEEQLILRNAQKKTLLEIGKTIIYGSLTLLIVAVGSAIYFTVRNRIRMHRELRQARVRIASDLHDDVGSNLGAIILHVEKLQEEITTAPEQKRLKSIFRLTRESVFGLREVLRTTAPEVGRAQDILAYMEELAGLLLGKTGFTFQADPSTNALLQNDSSFCKGVLLFYKEAVHNAKTHSGCSHVDISIRRENNMLIMRIRDNGAGIDEATLKKPQTLRTLKQRADWLQADLKIESVPGSGTGFTLTIEKTNQNSTP
ncbi:histidine kinase [Pontiellaceae bacterium B1224]|nr:histidine kinase [Pontiellaceae bacterium B1224]